MLPPFLCQIGILHRHCLWPAVQIGFILLRKIRSVIHLQFSSTCHHWQICVGFVFIYLFFLTYTRLLLDWKMKHSCVFCSATEKYLSLHICRQGKFDRVWVLVLAEYNRAEYVFIHHRSQNLLYWERGSTSIEFTPHNADSIIFSYTLLTKLYTL